MSIYISSFHVSLASECLYVASALYFYVLATYLLRLTCILVYNVVYNMYTDHFQLSENLFQLLFYCKCKADSVDSRICKGGAPRKLIV
uniref:Putative ovule protein n=1 Tax=Solanum chacoense TaxID=4108 RepID=A0A0V0IQ61_SOLCH